MSAPPLLADLQAPAPPGLPFRRGDRFPDLELPNVDGTGGRRISEWHGRHLMLHLFASW